MPHIFVNLLNSTVDVSDMQHKFGRKPAPCGMMVQEKCSHIIAGWGVGDKGTCYDGLNAATKIGKNGFKNAVLEVSS